MDNPYIHPTRIKAALRALDLRPTREMGQNFLVDAYALQQIVDAGELTRADTVIEVGPGLGVLTWELLQRAGRVVAIELDKRLAARLVTELGHDQRLKIIQSDMLKTDLVAALAQVAPAAEEPARLRPGPDTAYKVVANLPYAITSAALRHTLEALPPPTLIVVLVQWEVATRITARPGDMSVLAHSVQVYAEPEIIARVPRTSFFPSPVVDSAILRLRVRNAPLVPREQVDTVLKFIKAGFLQARKKLSNALPIGLASVGWPTSREQAVAALAGAGVDPDRRAETLTFDEWLQIYRALKQ